MSSLIQLTCKECGIQFQLLKKEYNRQLRRGRAPDFFFCSLSCGKSHTNRGNTNYKNNTKWRVGGDNHTDEFSPFRYYMKSIGLRKDKHECDIDLAYLKELWESQQGRCAYTGLPLRTRNHKTGRALIDVASLDRIDSSKGYVKGNVQFVSAALNLAKSDLPDSEFRQGLAELFQAYSQVNQAA